MMLARVWALAAAALLAVGVWARFGWPIACIVVGAIMWLDIYTYKRET